MYKLTKNVITLEREKAITYGISFNGNVLISDVSDQRQIVEDLIALFNEEGVLPRYAADLAEDFISKQGK